MRKLSIFTSLIIVASTLTLLPAHAATASAGANCSQAGLTSVVKGLKYTCVKSGKKLVWGKGVVSAGNSATTQNPIPIKLPAAVIGSITFDNLIDHIKDIPLAAWTEVQKVEKANTLPAVPTTIAIGPNTTPNVPDMLGTFQKVMKFFAGFRQPTTYYALVYNFQDAGWALKTAATIPAVKNNGGINGITGMPRMIAQCSAPERCGDANSGVVDPAGSGLGRYGIDVKTMVGQDGVYKPVFKDGALQGHEYTHSVQASQFLGLPIVGKPPTEIQRQNGVDNMPSGLYESALPCWWAEGQANFIGNSATAPTFDAYWSGRKGAAKGWSIPEFTDFSAASLQKFFETDMPLSCLPPHPIYQMGYGLGWLAIEALAAIAGPQSTMAVVTLMGRGQTYPQAFESVYGITWAKASPILAKLVAAEYAATPSHN